MTDQSGDRRLDAVESPPPRIRGSIRWHLAPLFAGLLGVSLLGLSGMAVLSGAVAFVDPIWAVPVGVLWLGIAVVTEYVVQVAIGREAHSEAIRAFLRRHS